MASKSVEISFQEIAFTKQALDQKYAQFFPAPQQGTPYENQVVGREVFELFEMLNFIYDLEAIHLMPAMNQIREAHIERDENGKVIFDMSEEIMNPDFKAEIPIVGQIAPQKPRRPKIKNMDAFNADVAKIMAKKVRIEKMPAFSKDLFAAMNWANDPELAQLYNILFRV